MKAYGIPLTDDHDNCVGICIAEDGKYLGRWTSSNYSFLKLDLEQHADGYEYQFFPVKPTYYELVGMFLDAINYKKDSEG